MQTGPIAAHVAGCINADHGDEWDACKPSYRDPLLIFALYGHAHDTIDYRAMVVAQRMPALADRCEFSGHAGS